MKKLLAICGKTPQIITEMLYALWEADQFPQEIHIITTKAGKEAIYTKLLHPKDGVFFTFCSEYEIDPASVVFSWETVFVPCTHTGQEIEDIRTEDDSVRFLQLCLEKTFELTANEHDTVFFSIAAGRKTMGAALTLAAQYYGRKQDRLYHVLVHEDFEYSHSFYYPPKKEKWVELVNSNGEKYLKSTNYATISLVNIPFFRIREQLSQQMLAKATSPDEIMALFHREEQTKLAIHMRKASITWANKTVTMPVAWLALYIFFAQKKQQNPATLGQDKKDFFELDDILYCKDDIAKIYGKINYFQQYKDANKSDTGILSLTAENFRSYKSKINAKIRKSFGNEAAKQIEIASFGTKPDTKYGIWLDASLITILTGDDA